MSCWSFSVLVFAGLNLDDLADEVDDEDEDEEGLLEYGEYRGDPPLLLLLFECNFFGLSFLALDILRKGARFRGVDGVM